MLAVHAEDLDCVVEPGVTRKQLNEHLRDSGLFFPIDPGADASLGGMAATRASGTNAVRYGTMKDNVLALKVVLANGEIDADRAPRQEILRRLRPHAAVRRLGGHARRHHRDHAASSHGIPEAISAGVCPFPSVEAACNATIATIQSGIPVARIELLDALQVKACNRLFEARRCRKRRMLFLEFHGTEAGVAEQSRALRRDRRGIRRRPVRWATKAEDRTRLWQARHDAYWARAACARARKAVRDRRVRADLAACRMRRPRRSATSPSSKTAGADRRPCRRRQFSRARLLLDMDDPDEVARARKAFSERLVERALAMDGTCTGEHGIGQGKMKYLAAEHGAARSTSMRAIKRALDPLDIMNPGKIVAF